MKTTTTKTTLILHLALAAAFLFAGLTRAAAQTASASIANTPALILSFDGQATNNTAVLTWVMENETNSKWFVIERAGNDGEYDSIGVVAGLNNNTMTTYTFSDNNMQSGNNYYRLRMIDMNNAVRYSRIVSLSDNAEETATDAVKMTVYPNPAAAMINYTVNAMSNEQVIVRVYNLSGVVLLSAEQQLNAGNNVQTLAVSNLKAGNYFLKVTNVEGNTQFVQPFVKIM